MAGGCTDLEVRQVLLRYDGQRTHGTLEATVCNLGTTDARSFDVVATVGSVTKNIATGLSLAAGSCTDVFDPKASFSTYGINVPGQVSVTVEVRPRGQQDPGGNNRLQRSLSISGLATVRDPAARRAYQSCRKTDSHASCLSYIPSEPSDNPHEIGKKLGSFEVILPSNLEARGAWALADNKVCSQKIGSYFAVPVPGWVMQRFLVSPGSSGSSYGSTTGIETTGDVAFYRSIESQLGRLWKETTAGVCHNAHELIHLFLGDVPLPSWLNEGLATYMESPKRTGHLPTTPECRAQGWYGIDVSGQTRQVPYEDLSDYDASVPKYNYYHTGACFWDYLESTSGHQKLQQVIKRLLSFQDPAFYACSARRKTTYFIRDIVNPILGSDISALTQARFGFGALFTGCEPALRSRLLSCPTNTGHCPESQMREKTVEPSGPTFVSKTFAVLVKHRKGRPLKVEAKLVDGWGTTAVVGGSYIVKPHDHSLIDKDSWLVRFDWPYLHGEGIRTERRLEWTAEVRATWGSNPSESVTFSLRVDD